MVRIILILSFLISFPSFAEPHVDFEAAIAVMKKYYKFDKSNGDFGTSDEEYLNKMELILQELEQGIVKSLYLDPWKKKTTPPFTTIDVLNLYTSPLKSEYSNLQDRLLLEEMFSNLAFINSGLPIRYRFKMLPLGNNIDAEQYRNIAGKDAESKKWALKWLVGHDKNLKKLRDEWGADVILLNIGSKERLASKNFTGNDPCGDSIREDVEDGEILLNKTAVAFLVDTGFCAPLFISTHELGHLFNLNHPTDVHEKKVNDDIYPYRFSMMGYRNDVCSKVTSEQCPRTLSFIPNSREKILSNYKRISSINPSKKWQ